MTFVLGTIIGAIMGLTGAGGALIAIPLFLQFLGMDLKEATVYSLVAVVIASFLNFFFQRKFSDYKLSVIFVILSTVGSILTNPFKKYLPEAYMAVLLGAVSIYSLYSIWKTTKIVNTPHVAPSWPITVVVGLSLGALTIFTGLGGGVLMLPLLTGVYGYDQNKAIATSLLTVALSSLSSLIIQYFSGVKFSFDMQLFGLVTGILLAAIGIKYLADKMPAKLLNNFRKVVFTVVVALALSKIITVNS